MRRLIDRLMLRVRSLLRSDDVDRSLQRELQDHLDEQTAEYVAAGMSPRRCARRGAASVRTRCRHRRGLPRHEARHVRPEPGPRSPLHAALADAAADAGAGGHALDRQPPPRRPVSCSRWPQRAPASRHRRRAKRSGWSTSGSPEAATSRTRSGANSTSRRRCPGSRGIRSKTRSTGAAPIDPCRSIRCS